MTLSGSDPATLLLVEDDPVLGQVLGQTLAKDGYVIRHVATAADAEREFAKHAPQLVLLDTCLREGTGLQLAESMRVAHAGVPCILLTVGPQPANQFRGWRADRILSKSTDLSHLRETVAAALNDQPGPLAPAETAAESHQLATPLNASPSQPEPLQRHGKEPSMRLFESKFVRYAAAAVVLLLIVATIGAANGALPLPGRAAAAETAETPAANSAESIASIELVPGEVHTLFLPEDVRKALGIRHDNVDLMATAAKPIRTRPLVMPGTTMLDPTRLIPVRALFAPSPSSAQVIEIGSIDEDRLKTGSTTTRRRELRSGDRVTKGNLLAIFYSVDVGNKKNDLIDALYQLKLDNQVYTRWEAKSSVVPEIQLWQQKKAVQADLNAINRAISTLRTWGISEEDIQAVRDEAERVKPDDVEKRLQQRDKSHFDRWARVEVKAPVDGLIVERNITPHTNVTDNTLNLFQIMMLDQDGSGPRLTVVANCPEDDIPSLQVLPDRDRRWTITTNGSQPFPGVIDDIMPIIDPMDHTAKIKGHIENKEGRLLAGKLVSVMVELPPQPDVVEVPTDAVVEDGQQCIVFVQTNAEKQYYTMRRVELMRRFDKTVFVRSKPFTKAEERTADEAELGMLPKQPLNVGDRILRTGVGELKTALLEKESQPQQKTVSGG